MRRSVILPSLVSIARKLREEFANKGLETNTIIIIHRAHMRTAQHKLKVHALRVIMEVHTSTMEQIGIIMW